MADGQVETQRCKHCGNDIAMANIQVHEIHCQRHLTKCRKCGQAVRDLKMHDEEEHRLVKCEHCTLEVEEDQLEEHKKLCSKRPVLCPYCSVEFPYSSYPEHEDSCGSRTDECEKCQGIVRLRDMLRHESSNCTAFAIQQQRALDSGPAYASFPARYAVGVEARAPLPKIPNSQANKLYSRPNLQLPASDERDMSPPLEELEEVRPQRVLRPEGVARPRAYVAARGAPGSGFSFAAVYFPATEDPNVAPSDELPPSRAARAITHERQAVPGSLKPSKEVKRGEVPASRGMRYQKPKGRTGGVPASSPQKKKAPRSINNEEVIVLSSDVKLPDPDSDEEECLPCEYCNMQLPTEVLLKHQADCGEGQEFDMYGGVKAEIHTQPRKQPIAIIDEPTYGNNETQEFVGEDRGDVKPARRQEEDEFTTRHFRHEDVRPLSHSPDHLRSTEGEDPFSDPFNRAYSEHSNAAHNRGRSSLGPGYSGSLLQQMMASVDPYSDGAEEEFAYCEHCDFPFPLNAIMQHEVLCPKAPGHSTAAPNRGYDMHPSANVDYGTPDLSPPKLSPTSDINSISLAERDYNRPGQDHPPSNSSRFYDREDNSNFSQYADVDDDLKLPCEFCNKDFGADMLQQHQFVCSKRFAGHSYGDEQDIGSRGQNSHPYSHGSDSGSRARNNRNRGLESTFNNNN